MKKVETPHNYDTSNTKKKTKELVEWTDQATDKIKRHSQEIKELEEKITTLEKVNEVNAFENQELKNEVNQLKEQIELLKEEIAKLVAKQQESELIAQIGQPPAYNN